MGNCAFSIQYCRRRKRGGRRCLLCRGGKRLGLASKGSTPPGRFFWAEGRRKNRKLFFSGKEGEKDHLHHVVYVFFPHDTGKGGGKKVV